MSRRLFIAFLLCALSASARADIDCCLIDAGDSTVSGAPWSASEASQEIVAWGFDESLAALANFPRLLRREQARVVSLAVGSRLDDLAGLCRRHIDGPLASQIHAVDSDFRDFARARRQNSFSTRQVARAQRHLRALRSRLTELETTRVYLTDGIASPVRAIQQFAANFGQALRNVGHRRHLWSGIPARSSFPPPLQRIPYGLRSVGAPVADLSTPAPVGFYQSQRSYFFSEAKSTLPYLVNQRGTYRYTIPADLRFSFRTPWLAYKDRRLSSSPASNEYEGSLLYAYDPDTEKSYPARTLSRGTTIDLTPYFTAVGF